jgi:uncharacterized SAM-binding protein YcdF (DUF218 family)
VSANKADVLVVLGAALGPDGDLGPALAERVHAGVAAWEKGYAPRLMMTGACEAEIMRQRAVRLGVPPEQILVEPSARTTRENALRCAELMRAQGLSSALVVTQGYHRPRAVAAFRRAGVEATGYRFTGMWRARWQLRELGARLVYKLRGWT